MKIRAHRSYRCRPARTARPGHHRRPRHARAGGSAQRLAAVGKEPCSIIHKHLVWLRCVIGKDHVNIAVVIHIARIRRQTIGTAQNLQRVGEHTGAVIQVDLTGLRHAIDIEHVQIAVAIHVAQINIRTLEVI